MGKYIVKRVILAIFTIFIISLITFFAMNAIPGGPFNSEKAKSPAVMKELEARYGLDQPLIVQYKNYMAGVLHGDFGVSLKTDRPISDIIGESFPISAKLGLLAALTAIVFGVVLGSIAALMRNRWPDRVIVFFVTLITSMPSFVIATLLLYFFCIKLGVVQAFSSGSNMILLPVLSLSLSPMAYITRLTKTSMLDALNLNYYKKTTFTGWMNGMRFLIKREEPVIKEATEDTPEEKGEPIFHAWIWPGPYIFDLTDDSKKTDNTFPFTDDGKKQCVDWINEVISAHSNEYPKNKTDGENE